MVLDTPVRNGYDGTTKQRGVALKNLKYSHGSPSMTARILANPSSLMDSKYYAAYALRNRDGKKNEGMNLRYEDLGDRFTLSAANNPFRRLFPEWQFDDRGTTQPPLTPIYPTPAVDLSS